VAYFYAAAAPRSRGALWPIFTPALIDALEKAFVWVMRDFPTFDEARLADFAEALATSMQARGSGISSPKQFAYPALRGKVLDSLRKGSAKEQTSGISRDLERIGGSSSAFQGSLDRKILLDQIQNALSTRDRDILLLIRQHKSAQEIATELQTSYPTARKAIQRVNERIQALANTSRKGKDKGDQKAVDHRGLAVE
jgi:DNA-directed RNA polymerase specialized sigma24 family protein